MRSPFGHIFAHRLPVLRRRLTGDTALLDFAVFEEFRAFGGIDYIVFLVGFDRASQNGVICSWLGDRAAGFTDNEIMQLQRVTRELSIALKSKIERNVAQNIAHAYLGKRAGQAVLNGLIRRGDGEKVTAALWYSDLRHSTELADRLSAEAFLQLLGRYFEMTASSVLDHGGEVVSLIGDAVLGLFRFEGAPDEACRPGARRSPRSAPPTQHTATSGGRRRIRFRHIAPPGPGYLWQRRSARAVAVHAGRISSQRGRSSAGPDEKAGLPTACHRSLRRRNRGPMARTGRASLART